MRKNLILSLIGLVLVSCAQDSIVKESGKGLPDPLETHITSAQARERLSTILMHIGVDGEMGTRSISVIGECVPLTRQGNMLTRSEEKEADCYSFTINNGEAFAIMSADTKLPELLAIGRETPNFEDVNAVLPDTNLWKVPHGTEVGIDTDSVGLIRDKPIYTYLTKPQGLCPVKWGQHQWYNEKCPIVQGTNEHAATGCVATAVAQIMACENFRPLQYEDIQFEWPLMIAAWNRNLIKEDPIAHDYITNLMQFLVNKDNIDPVEWGVNTTWAYDDNVIRTFENFGFSSTKDSIFDESPLGIFFEELTSGYPIYMRASDELHDYGGHAFIVHGILMCETPVNVVSYKTGKILDYYIETSYYLQINWGWNAKSDGFYLQGCYDLRDLPPISEENGLSNSDKYNFVEGFRIFYGMRKK